MTDAGARPALQGARLTLPIKLMLLAFATQLVQLAILVLLAEALADAGTATRALAFGLPLLMPVVIVFVVTRYIVRRTTVPLIDAYHRIAAGDFQAELPLITAGSDFAVVRQAFTAMSRALEHSMAQLREADLERRRLFADLAHELSTPTTTLLGISHALRAGTGEPRQLLDHLDHESARLERLIADIREVAHIEDPGLLMLIEPCDLGALAVPAIERARLGASDVALRCTVVPALVTADPMRVDQVLANLLANAVRHARAGGGEPARAAAVALEVRIDGDHAVVRVEDSGAGVPDELMHQLGRRLLRLDPSRDRATGGNGLGLAIVRSIIARHHGQVSFARAELGGLAVEVRLPRP